MLWVSSVPFMLDADTKDRQTDLDLARIAAAAIVIRPDCDGRWPCVTRGIAD